MIKKLLSTPETFVVFCESDYEFDRLMEMAEDFGDVEWWLSRQRPTARKGEAYRKGLGRDILLVFEYKDVRGRRSPRFSLSTRQTVREAKALGVIYLASEIIVQHDGKDTSTPIPRESIEALLSF